MNYIKYKRHIVFLRSLTCALAVGVGVWAIYRIPTENFFEQVVSVMVVIVTFGFTGQYMIILLYFLLRSSSALLKYDEKHFYYKNKKSL
ncbi:hypothetical protein [Priestia endophytica]|uniref:hypothetical protein n=1 Tax=Priestia endophytica TaxID=135735 RepID=UPI00227E8AC8|nr:hypothetical protein [Priestia endophytica]MCY8234153.1 hypothetical protein [Priestia endophytica]